MTQTPQPNNLDALLEACGTSFRSLSLHSDDRWIAKSGRRAFPTNKQFSGKTAQQAVYKLLLELNCAKL